jgi:hypothetical protein
VDQQDNDREAPTPPQDPKAATVGERLGRLWPRRTGQPRPVPGSSDLDWDPRLAKIEARVRHLEAALEGLQDSVYRQALRNAEQIEELHKRTDPEQVARDLSRDARKRGL